MIGLFKLERREEVRGNGDGGREYHGKEEMMGKETSGKGPIVKKCTKLTLNKELKREEEMD